MYCVYLTVYRGNLMPKYYIGHSTVLRVINSGYRGSVLSKAYRETWKKELRDNPQLFKTRILSIWDTRENAVKEEVRIQKKYSVHNNPRFINRHINAESFFSGGIPVSQETKDKISKTKASHPYKHPPDVIERIRQARLGKKHSESTKDKMREAAADSDVKAKVKKGAANSVARRLLRKPEVTAFNSDLRRL